MNFTERTPIEAGFEAVFKADVKPKLLEFEFERQAVHRKTRIQTGLIIAAAVAIFALLLWYVGDEEGPFAPLLIAVVIGYAGVTYVNYRASIRWRSQVKDIAMPAICSHLGDLTHSASGDTFPLEAMIALRLVPDTQYKHRRNLMSGSYHGTGFSAVHARLLIEGGGRADPVTHPARFQGLLFQIDLPRPAPGQIAVIRDWGRVGNKLAETFSVGGTRSMPKVAVNQADLEDAFEVYAEDPDAAKAFLTDRLVKALLRFGYEHGANGSEKSITAGFDNSTFYLALRRGDDFLSVGDLGTPVEEIEEELHGVFSDIALIHSVIDGLNDALTSLETQT